MKIENGYVIAEFISDTIWAFDDEIGVILPLRIKSEENGILTFEGVIGLDLPYKWRYANFVDGIVFKGILDRNTSLSGRLLILNNYGIESVKRGGYCLNGDGKELRAYLTAEAAIVAMFADKIDYHEYDLTENGIAKFISLQSYKFKDKYKAAIERAKEEERVKEEKRKAKEELERQKVLNSPYKTYLMVNRDGNIKIGKSKNPSRRKGTLMAQDCSQSIQLFAVCERNVEKDLHRRYAKQRMIGEWFNLSKHDITDIVAEYNFKLQ